jgi:hypothetical protein
MNESIAPHRPRNASIKNSAKTPALILSGATLALISQQKNKKAVVSWHNSYSE